MTTPPSNVPNDVLVRFVGESKARWMKDTAIINIDCGSPFTEGEIYSVKWGGCSYDAQVIKISAATSEEQEQLVGSAQKRIVTTKQSDPPLAKRRRKETTAATKAVTVPSLASKMAGSLKRRYFNPPVGSKVNCTSLSTGQTSNYSSTGILACMHNDIAGGGYKQVVDWHKCANRHCGGKHLSLRSEPPRQTIPGGGYTI